MATIGRHQMLQTAKVIVTHVMKIEGGWRSSAWQNPNLGVIYCTAPSSCSVVLVWGNIINRLTYSSLPSDLKVHDPPARRCNSLAVQNTTRPECASRERLVGTHKAPTYLQMRSWTPTPCHWRPLTQLNTLFMSLYSHTVYGSRRDDGLLFGWWRLCVNYISSVVALDILC